MQSYEVCPRITFKHSLIYEWTQLLTVLEHGVNVVGGDDQLYAAVT